MRWPRPGGGYGSLGGLTRLRLPHELHATRTCGGTAGGNCAVSPRHCRLVPNPLLCLRGTPALRYAWVKVGGSPSPSGSRKTVELGAPPAVPSSNRNSRVGQQSPHGPGRVMKHPCFVGIDVSTRDLERAAPIRQVSELSAPGRLRCVPASGGRAARRRRASSSREFQDKAAERRRRAPSTSFNSPPVPHAGSGRGPPRSCSRRWGSQKTPRPA